ncbi:peptidase S53 [Burkholderia sp. Ac-20345]|uniref:putative Ig domain-containing protein n=1 Tax=Burkholderia sp. Ac-20345 TaxID=2703891 RepID=UPI00197BE530|nr:peptidase S53 [Burkholderia sp. Ac-20345]
MVVLTPLLLLACGGGDNSSSPASAASSAVSIGSSSTLSLSPLSDSEANATVTPTFYTAPVELNAPPDIDSGSPSASAHQRPVSQATDPAMEAVSRAQLTPQAIAASAAFVSPSTTNPKSVRTYTPAQIRAAYSLPALPTSWNSLSASEAAQMGAGQTIYVIDARDDPNIAAELATFSQKFGLPPCTTTTIPASANLPITAAGPSCQFSVVYSTSRGGMTSSAPAYHAGWASEIALDVQWAHATAPLARIVLIEAPNAFVSSLAAATTLANAMGPGVVSMSFGAPEGSWTASVDSAFSNAKMTYVAAAGDRGTEVIWPSVSPHVLAVGGTSLTYNGMTRSETVWSHTGGGISRYTWAPAYQKLGAPNIGTLSMRSVADVSFNANPSTGQYVAIMTPGRSAAKWYSFGGTSLATPQWAGIAAIANAARAQNALGPLGLLQTSLYGRIATSSTLFASAFDDITVGNDGACPTCSAHAGYDQPSGLGTPNVTSLLSAISTTSEQAPVVSPVSVKGIAGSTLSFSIAATAPEAVTWSLSNAPYGMTINSSGQVTWPQPVSGSYAVTATATATMSGLSGSAMANVTISAVHAPIIEAATIAGRAGMPLAYQVDAIAANSLSFSINSAPSGMAISSSGLISWTSPIAGTYSFGVTATDTKTGQTGTAVLQLRISAAASGPVIDASTINGAAGRPVAGIVGISDSEGRNVNVSIKGAPAGMMFFASGQGILLVWPRAIAGTYTLTVTAVDSSGLSSQASVVVTIVAG